MRACFYVCTGQSEGVSHTYSTEAPLPSDTRKKKSGRRWYGAGNILPDMAPTIYHEVGKPTNTNRFQQPTSLAELKQKRGEWGSALLLPCRGSELPTEQPSCGHASLHSLYCLTLVSHTRAHTHTRTHHCRAVAGTYVDYLGPSTTSGCGVDVYVGVVGDVDSGDDPQTCQYTSGSGRVCKSTLADGDGGSVYCANHTCTASGCTASTSSQESLCTAHSCRAGAVVADAKDSFIVRPELRLSREGTGLRAKSVRRSNPLFSSATSTIPLRTHTTGAHTAVGTSAAGTGTPGLASDMSMGEPMFLFDGSPVDEVSLLRQTTTSDV